ncbi:hypothetical protein QBC45DRAFT_412530 [Copromyces sp. CBS 386.78]|nr:hypothetical protein QBC45DRAFT_412530 [Copromyces sp. CBS 386.78]
MLTLSSSCLISGGHYQLDSFGRHESLECARHWRNEGTSGGQPDFGCSFFPFPPLLLRLCYDTSSSKWPIVEKCMRRDGQLPLACSRSLATFSRAFARRFFPFLLSGTGNRVGHNPFFLRRLVPPLLRFSFAGARIRQSGLCVWEGCVCPSSFLGCHMALFATPMILLARDHQGRATNPSVCVTFSSLCVLVIVKRDVDQ